jgi:hypothetical protein
MSAILPHNIEMFWVTLRSDLAIILDEKKSQVSVTRVLDSFFSTYICVCVCDKLNMII